jgi:hypothetical protein
LKGRGEKLKGRGEKLKGRGEKLKGRGEEFAGGDLQKGVGVDARARREALQPRDLAAAEDERKGLKGRRCVI